MRVFDKMIIIQKNKTKTKTVPNGLVFAHLLQGKKTINFVLKSFLF